MNPILEGARSKRGKEERHEHHAGVLSGTGNPGRLSISLGLSIYLSISDLRTKQKKSRSGCCLLLHARGI